MPSHGSPPGTAIFCTFLAMWLIFSMVLIEFTAVPTVEQVAQNLHPVLGVETVEQLGCMANLHLDGVCLTLAILFLCSSEL